MSFFLYTVNYGSHRITPSNATNAMAFAGNALRKQGTNPRQYPLHPRSRPTATAASFQDRNFLSPSPKTPPMGSVMSRCFTKSDGYEVIQNSWADSPPAQKLMAGLDILVRSFIIRVRMS